MEKQLIIKTPDKKNIQGTFSQAKKKSKRLIIFVHSFTGGQNEHIIFNGAKFFTNKGFDTYRFNLYAGDYKNTRHFKDTKISLHGNDIDTVVKYFRKKYEKIYLIGHSYGGTSLLFTNYIEVDSYVFWDASYIDPVNDGSNDMKFNENLGKYIMDYGIEILVGKPFIDELKNFPDCGEMISKINKPVFIITAGAKGNYNAGLRYFKSANNPKKLISIKSADHNFNNWDDENSLFEETYNCLK